MADDEPMWKIVVLVPMKLDRDTKDMFVNKIWDAAYEVQDAIEDRDWDIFCYATPEEDDK